MSTTRKARILARLRRNGWRPEHRCHCPEPDPVSVSGDGWHAWGYYCAICHAYIAKFQ